MIWEPQLTREVLTGEWPTKEVLTGEALTGEALTRVVLTGEALTREVLTGEALTGEVLIGEVLIELEKRGHRQTMALTLQQLCIAKTQILTACVHAAKSPPKLEWLLSNKTFNRGYCHCNFQVGCPRLLEMGGVISLYKHRLYRLRNRDGKRPFNLLAVSVSPARASTVIPSTATSNSHLGRYP